MEYHESVLRKKLLEYIKLKSEYGSYINNIFSKTPQSFSNFPTIILKEVNNTDNILGKTLDNLEYIDDISVQVEIYSKDIVHNKKRVSSLVIVNSLKEIIHNFFRELGFIRETSQPSEYIDINIDRYVFLFSSKVQNWNNQLI